MENPIKMDDSGVPLFLETPINAYLSIFAHLGTFKSSTLHQTCHCASIRKEMQAQKSWPTIRSRSSDVQCRFVAACWSWRKYVDTWGIDADLLPFHYLTLFLKPILPPYPSIEASASNNNWFWLSDSWILICANGRCSYVRERLPPHFPWMVFLVNVRCDETDAQPLWSINPWLGRAFKVEIFLKDAEPEISQRCVWSFFSLQFRK